MKIKHSKFRNTGLIFELLVKQVASDTLNNKDSAAVSIIKKYYSGKTALAKEFKLYEFITKNKKKTNTDGTIDFINGSKMFLNDSIYNHKPKVGDVLLFPNYLMHTAYPFSSEGERRSFSFNLEIDKNVANVFSK